MAGRPLRPATDLRLGRPLPHQQANPTQVHPNAEGHCWSPPLLLRAYSVLPKVSLSYPHHLGRSPRVTHPSATRQLPEGTVTVRLACVKHAASVQSEPGSNSSIKLFRVRLRSFERFLTLGRLL